MPSVYRRPRSPYWYVDVSLPDGSRARRSTGQTAKRAAQAAADTMVAKLRETAVAPGTPTSLGAALDRYVARLTARGQSSARGAAALALKTTTRLGRDLPLHDLTTAALQALHDARLDAGAAVQTANHEVKNIKAAVNLAAAQGYKVPALRFKLPAPPNKTRYLSWEEFLAVKQHLETPAANGHVTAQRLAARDLLVALVMTGGRWSEVARLTWDQLDCVRWGSIRLWGSKDQQERVVPIPEALGSILRSRWARRGNSLLVFPAADPDTVLAQPSQAIYRAMTACGLNAPHLVARHGKATIHSLRHTFASWLLQRGLSLSEVQALLGHASPAMTQRYAHLAVGQTVARAASVLDALDAAA